MPEKRAGFDELLVQLRATNALLARSLSVNAGIKQADLVVLLDQLGLPTAEIAKIVGTTANTVNVTLSRNRQKAARLRGA